VAYDVETAGSQTETRQKRLEKVLKRIKHMFFDSRSPRTKPGSPSVSAWTRQGSEKKKAEAAKRPTTKKFMIPSMLRVVNLALASVEILFGEPRLF
jgi:hypothetical protein